MSDLFLRLPQIWAKLDTAGILERYLSVWDGEFDRISDFVAELLDSRNIDRADDRFIPYKGDAVGHEFTVRVPDVELIEEETPLLKIGSLYDVHLGKVYDRTEYLVTMPWNRAQTSVAVTRHSFKGTWAEIADLVERHGGLNWSSVDMMSQIIVPGSQGCPGGTASYLMGANLYHPGARKLIVDTNLDLPNFLEDFLPTRAAGEVWYIYIKDEYDVETLYEYR